MHALSISCQRRLQVAASFRCADKVLSVAMSGCAGSHVLIAVGSKKSELVLADIASGALTHTLDGHRWGQQSTFAWYAYTYVLLGGGAHTLCCAQQLLGLLNSATQVMWAAWWSVESWSSVAPWLAGPLLRRSTGRGHSVQDAGWLSRAVALCCGFLTLACSR